MAKQNQDPEWMSVSLATLICTLTLGVGIALGSSFGQQMQRHEYLDAMVQAEKDCVRYQEEKRDGE